MTKQHKTEIEQAKALSPSPKNKRINTVAKGRRNEKKTEKWLEERGWLVQTTRRSSYKGGDNDFFGLFDHIAVVKDISCQIRHSKKVRGGYIWEGKKESFFSGTTLFVQTKSNRLTKKVAEKIMDFPARNKAVFIWHDGKAHPEIYLYLERYSGA